MRLRTAELNGGVRTHAIKYVYDGPKKKSPWTGGRGVAEGPEQRRESAEQVSSVSDLSSRLGPSQPGELGGGAKARHRRLASRTLTASQPCNSACPGRQLIQVRFALETTVFSVHHKLGTMIYNRHARELATRGRALLSSESQ